MVFNLDTILKNRFTGLQFEETDDDKEKDVNTEEVDGDEEDKEMKSEKRRNVKMKKRLKKIKK
jgi:hypothetical protein